ncbi:MAG: AMP-binding protein [Thermodesulfobacteriota bacterium]|nr:AMP-binding protein [Thermodesulfobacteriota bacterium]
MAKKKLEVSDRWRKLKDKTWFEILEDVCSERPEHEAIVFKDERITYLELKERVIKLAKGLHAIGLRRGDHVAIWMTNRPEYIIARFAIYKIGAVMVTISTRYGANDLEFVLNHCDARAMIMEDKFLGNIESLNMLRGLCPELDTAPPGGLISEKFPFLRSVICADDKFNGCFSWLEVEDKGNSISDKEIDAATSPDDIAHMLYTSGTTGFPKGVMMYHSNSIIMNAIFADVHNLEPEDRYLDVPPLFGNIGLSCYTSSMIVGMTVVFTERFDPKGMAEILEKEKIGHTMFIPTMLVDLMALPDIDKYDLSLLKYAVVGGAYVPPDLIVEANEKLGIECINAYGLVEASGLSTGVPAGDTPEHLTQTVGLPFPSCELTIRDVDTNEEVPLGQEGEICTKEVFPGSQWSKGYYKQPDLTEELFKDGWCHSGDLGVMDAEGYVRITGRAKEMFTVGGFNVSPPEIEKYLRNHPKIEDVAVAGIPDKRLGEIGAAFVRLEKGQTATTEEIIDFCKGQITDVKIPKHVFFVKEFPLSHQFKVQKFKLREMAIKELGLEE